jgi:hypothetical protein
MAKYYFSKVVDRYFNHWIRQDTWHTGHPLDLERFCQFLKAIRKYSRRRHWTAGFHDNIVEAAKLYHPEMDEISIFEMADHFTDKAETVFAYEAAMFPHPLVEMTNADQVWSYLYSLQVADAEGNPHGMYSLEEIEKLVAESFGKDWREKRRKRTRLET